MKNLIKLYNIYNPSTYEYVMSEHVQISLDKMGIPYQVDKYNQIYSINPGEPLLCAHMDAVSTKPCKHIMIYKDKICGTSNIGADDKNGIWIALELLKVYPTLSFIFSVEEEIGGKINTLPLNELSEVPYGLIFDRKGNGDIIGTLNEYCCNDLEDDIEEIGSLYGYKAQWGVFSDCDAIRYHLPCVNLSCGYYNAHTDKEYTIISEIKNSLAFGKDLIYNLPRDKEYKKPNVSKYDFWNNYTYAQGTDNYEIEWVCDCGCTNWQDEPRCWECGMLYTDIYGIDEFDMEEYEEDYKVDVMCPFCKAMTSETDACDECIEATYLYYDLDVSKINKTDKE